MEALKTARAIGTDGRDIALDLAGVAHVDRAHFDPKGRRHGLDYTKLAGPGGYIGITNDCRSHHARCDLLEHLHPFPTFMLYSNRRKPVAFAIADRPSQAIDKAGAANPPLRARPANLRACSASNS